MEETFTYDGMNRLTGVTLKRPSGQDLHCAVTYDALGRMTSRQAVTAVNGTPQVTSVFSQPVFDATKVHALASATTTAELFPSDDQAVTYTGFDKVGKVVQGDDSVCFAYGHDRQRILMEEHVGGLTRAKQYWGACEYVTESDGGTTNSCWRTFVSGPYGMFAVVETRSGMDEIHYVLKDNLGSWTTITDGNGTVEQRLSYDAWGNLRDPNTWANYTVGDPFDKPMFDRGYTGHEHLTEFGLINMNGRMYDPVMSTFLSPDRFVQNPMTAMGFNRYAYCMNNPLRFVDPSGWRQKEPVVGPLSSSCYVRDFYTYAEHAYEPGDFRNAYYLFNMAFYGDMGGPGGGIGSGGKYYGSYGYHVSHHANSVYNYCSISTQRQLIQNWQNDPCYTTNKELGEAGISSLTVGELYGDYEGESGYRNSYYTWTDSNGKTHKAVVLYENVGGNLNGAFTVSNMPLELYGAMTPLEKANIMAQSIGVPMGTISETVEMAAKSYHDVPLLKIRSGLTTTQKLAALSKDGVSLLKVSKGLGHICAVVSVGISSYETVNYYYKGGKGPEVFLKGLGDVGMIAAGVFGGPIGLGISVGYFVVDLSTDGFGVSYEIKP